MDVTGNDNQLLNALLTTLEHHILPMTRQGVAQGNKIFGAALLKKSDLSVVLAETNNETENPLWHGEVHALKRFFEQPEVGRPLAKDLIFLSTHEPCPMCLSAITWAGFDNFYSFFTHEDSRDAFAIPHDLKILKEVFGLDPGRYRRKNAFWQSRFVRDMIAVSDKAVRSHFEDRAAAIAEEYAYLSTLYQQDKHQNTIPLN
ncbi:nucleoside deaminase [Rhizobium sp. P28RR-XV]|uniref:nucleoside deaminase n=1 Tax=Rhizobium sp. P28RR-XV TaxID=2726737 RepID=UPI001457801C|nr:nucleoside deaminase [Rhizobium sp. P28RR-XV]